MKIVYFNDTGKEINIHPGTLSHGTQTSTEPIKPLEERVFELPGTYPWIMMCEHDGQLSIFVSGKQGDEQKKVYMKSMMRMNTTRITKMMKSMKSMEMMKKNPIVFEGLRPSGSMQNLQRTWGRCCL